MIFKIFELISFISKSMMLEKGDLIATGTPAGVGVFSEGKKLLKPGDAIICEIEKIGRLKNKVVLPEDIVPPLEITVSQAARFPL